MSDDDENKTNIKSDYEYSRDTYYELIKTGKEALDLALQIASDTEHPRAIEVLSGMIKNVSDTNDKLMDLNKKNKDINTEKNRNMLLPNDGKTVNNNVFVGSTAELQKMLKGDNEKTISGIVTEVEKK